MFENLKRWLQDKIGIGENRDKIIYLEKRVKLNHLLLQQLLPKILALNPEDRNIPFLKTLGDRSNLNLAIHKNDLMFLQILIAKNGNVDAALNEYYHVGYETAQLLKGIVAGKPIQNLLDFGAGYGRVARFLSLAFSNSTNVFASDIKEEAVNFNRNSLNLNGLNHSTEIASYNPIVKFDLIFAGSVFTHLPEADSEKWLHALAESLEKDGMLVFSVHNIRSFGVSKTAHFAFKKLSEDSFFDSVEDSIKEADRYGTSYVSSEKVAEWMRKENLSFEILPNGFGGIQDLVIATKAN